MILKFFLSSCFVVFLISSKAQVNDNFNDGNFTNDPSWAASSTDFTINSALQLQSANNIPNSIFYITTPNSLATAVEWELYIRLAFNPSSANYVDVYLIASSADITSNTTTGYFVRIGNTDDEISLYRQDGNGMIKKIIDGENGVLNSSNNSLKLKVTRDTNNQFTLYRDLSGTGNNYFNEGTIKDETYATSAFFGLLIKQSTASFFQKHFFDDVQIRNFTPDVTAPSIVSATATSSTTVDVLFNEPVESTSSQLVSNYLVNNNFGNPESAFKDANNASLIHLKFNKPLTNGLVYTLEINGVADLSGNIINHSVFNFNYYMPQKYDVVIDEIMADPSPQVALPNTEWIELKNTSTFPVNLRGWRLANLTNQSGPMPDFILKPDSFVIITQTSSASVLNSFGSVVGVSNFPSLANDGDLVSIYSAEGQAMHAVEYSSNWYQNEVKKNGGWSLEMIDPKNACSGINNWKVSFDPKGGTPGKKNSVDGINIDQNSPKLLRAFALSNTKITLVFDEPLDTITASILSNYKISNGFSVVKTTAISPLFNKVIIELNAAMIEGNIYTVAANNLTDCQGNNIAANTTKVGLSQEPDSMDIVINEILFHPRPGGADYVEIYNRSQKTFDLSKMYIANRNGASVISSIKKIATESILFFPGDFMVLTSDPSAVKDQYITTNPDAFIKVPSFPSYPNDKGDVIILNTGGSVIDEVQYSDKWHFPLITNTEGISLERINYNNASRQNNFQSAATLVGFGTPGYKNSQSRLDANFAGTIKIYPPVFSPDNDGTDDFAMIEYNFPAPGYVANITVFDASGHPVRFLQKNALCGLKGNYRWDGLDDKNRKLPQGIYIVFTEIFNVAGTKKQFKNTIVLARKN
ncbi:MAG: lamin tail domain-containing protein [Ginsengibacter sp.]